MLHGIYPDFETSRLKVRVVSFEEETCRWGLFERDTSERIGAIQFYFDREAGAFSYEIDASSRDRGLVEEALEPLVQFMFNTMRLKEVGVIEDGLKLEAIGFEKEGNRQVIRRK
ncbi:GNAT family N-acetyltransferase [Exiguobacterium flavidum]|uniref:GNAT family N-acetyltransferase n=1 Tax=Exiguobacterium flavidum TaxID=2184695 RepID=UPI0013002117|nr:GNAT family N-acetyltransferase [Exiguobacterium flavidum]